MASICTFCAKNIWCTGVNLHIWSSVNLHLSPMRCQSVADFLFVSGSKFLQHARNVCEACKKHFFLYFQCWHRNWHCFHNYTLQCIDTLSYTRCRSYIYSLLSTGSPASVALFFNMRVKFPSMGSISAQNVLHPVLSYYHQMSLKITSISVSHSFCNADNIQLFIY